MRVSLFVSLFLATVVLITAEQPGIDEFNSNREKLALFLRLAKDGPNRRCANHDTTPIAPEGCASHQIWMFVRHATKNSAELSMEGKKLTAIRDKILKYHEKGRVSLSSDVLAELSAWSPTVFEREQIDELSASGQFESKKLGSRYKMRVPDLFNQSFDEETYAFRSSPENRAVSTMESFATALFHDDVQITYPEPNSKDPIIKFYSNCTKYRNEVSKNPNALKEMQEFERSNHMTNAQIDVQLRLGYKKKNLKSRDLEIMYSACVLETAQKTSGMSVWCNVFSEESIKVMEYREDLGVYWKDGYGFDITYQHACYPIKHMVDNFRNSRNSDGNAKAPKAFLNFGHSGGIGKIIAALGLFKDETSLRADNYEEMQNRKWRTSSVLCHAANIAFVQFKCGDDFKYSFLHNERLLSLPFCKEGKYCSEDEFEASFGKMGDECRYPEICDD